ncbi:hypothetical protein FOMPIDRAFT_58991, partial [Fomitopsis schrenkii]
MLDVTDTSTVVLKLGRAIQVTVMLKHGEKLKILGIYTLNDPLWNGYLWEDVKEFYSIPQNHSIRQPDMMAGDFNMVEEAIDRLPPREDRKATCTSLAEAKSTLQLQDTWRHLNPTMRAYTFHQTATGSQSRIDRIYTTERLAQQTREWDMSLTGIPGTDHWLTSVCISTEAAPWLGTGKRTVPLYVLQDKRMRSYIKERGTQALGELVALDGWRTQEQNPQRLLHTLKMDIREKAIARQRKMVPMLIKDINTTRTALNETLKD